MSDKKDIIVDLKAVARQQRYFSKKEKIWTAVVCDDAVSEIERLKKEVKRLQGVVDVLERESAFKIKLRGVRRLEFSSVGDEFKVDPMYFGSCPVCMSVPTPTASLCKDCEKDIANEY